MRTAHSKTFGSLTRSKDGGSVDDCELRAVADAAAEAQQHVAQLGADFGGQAWGLPFWVSGDIMTGLRKRPAVPVVYWPSRREGRQRRVEAPHAHGR